MKIASYNLNGIRAANKLNFMEWIKRFDADIYCFQEVRAGREICTEILKDCGYEVICNCGERAGYSGTITLTKIKPDKIECGINQSDIEGRTITLYFGNTVIINSYVPNGTKRLDYKLSYFEQLTKYVTELKKQYSVILCSDTNIAHTQLDVSHPKVCGRQSGYLPIEREKMTELLSRGFADAFRELNPNKQAYSWRSYRSRKIGGNFGWKFRYDYIIVDKNTMSKVKSAEILELEYSDHLPIVLEIEIL